MRLMEERRDITLWIHRLEREKVLSGIFEGGIIDHSTEGTGGLFCHRFSDFCKKLGGSIDPEKGASGEAM